MALPNRSYPNCPKGKLAFTSVPSASSAAVLGTCRVGREPNPPLSCRAPGLLFWARFGRAFADAADGADGIFERPAHPVLCVRLGLHGLAGTGSGSCQRATFPDWSARPGPLPGRQQKFDISWGRLPRPIDGTRMASAKHQAHEGESHRWMA
jgi:hypothetical protein